MTEKYPFFTNFWLFFVGGFVGGFGIKILKTSKTIHF